MLLKEIATISGMSGLFKVYKSTAKGAIMESLDAKKEKVAIGTSHRVSILQEVSIYTTDKEGTILLANVLHAIHEKYQGVLPVTPKSEGKELLVFLKTVVENYDTSRVYASDVKKLVSWYLILLTQAPETLVLQIEEEVKAEEIENEETEKA